MAALALSPLTRRSLTAFVVAIVWLAWMPAPHAEPVTIIRNNGPSANRVDLVILGDGYTAAEIASGQYANDVEDFVQGMFGQEPYSEYRNYFNVTRIDVESAESGADHPATGIFKNTALDAAYDCAGIQRLICVNVSKVNTIITNSGIAANARDTVLVIVNDPEYGGSGGSVAVASIHSAVVELVLHELGHSFGFLADEYGGPPPPSCNLNEPPNANATRETIRAFIKWNVWIDPSTPVPTPINAGNGVPGLFEGAVYCDTGAYRPTLNSKMRSLGPPFEQINDEQHIRRIYNFVSPLDDSSPAGSIIWTGPSQAFMVSLPQPLTHDLEVVWQLDGAVEGFGPVYTASGMPAGQHTVTATITDPTAMVRNDPSGLLSEVRTWTVNVTIPGPTITQHPKNRSIVATSNTTFAAAATGTGTVTWQWQVSTNGGATWVTLTDVPPYSGVTTPTLSLTNTPLSVNGHGYRAMATDTNGSTATNAAQLTVFGAGVNMLQNGDFSGGMIGWQIWEVPDIVSSVVDGVFQFFKQSPPTTPSGQAAVFQHTGVSLGSFMPLTASFKLGNSSTVRKRITVVILDSDFSDLHVCTFFLAANAPLRTYQATTYSNQAWGDVAIYFYAASGGSNGGNYLIDDVTLSYDPAGSMTQTNCLDPTAPAPPGGAPSATLLGNGSFSTGALAPWDTFGTITWQISGGAFEFHRPSATPPAGVLLQGTGRAMPAGQILTATFQLANSSSQRRRVTLLVHDADFSDLSACTFWLRPNHQWSNYSMRVFATKAWSNTMFSLYSATVGAFEWVRFDNAVLQTTPASTALGTECMELGPVTRPRQTTEVADGRRRTDMSGLQPAGRSAGLTSVPGPSSNVAVGGSLSLDLRDATSVFFTFQSHLPLGSGPGEVQLSLDGVRWETVAIVPASEDWLPVTIDASPFAGQSVYVRFAEGEWSANLWHISGLSVTIFR